MGKLPTLNLNLNHHNMGLFDIFEAFGHDDASQHYQNVYYTEQIQPHHKASMGHEGTPVRLSLIDRARVG